MHYIQIMYIAAAVLTFGGAVMSLLTANKRTAFVSILNAVVIAVTSTNVVNTTRNVDLVTAFGTLAAGAVVFIVSLIELLRKGKEKRSSLE